MLRETNQWHVQNPYPQQKLITKIKANGLVLGEHVDGKIFRGILTGLNKAFVIDARTRDAILRGNRRSNELIKPFLFGKNIKRYERPESDNFLILIPKGWTNKRYAKVRDKWGAFCQEYPEIARHIEPFAEAAQARYDKGDYWWELRACYYYDEFTKPKMLIPDISLRANATLDTAGDKYCVNTSYIIASGDLYLLGLLNSALVSFFYSRLSSAYRGGYLRFIYQYMVQIPIRQIDMSIRREKVRHDEMVSLVQSMLDLNKSLSTAKTPAERAALERQIAATDDRIDRLVYELYGLTDEEIAIVEESTK